tara:strand:+ start:4143 stop:5033 length:891 start_codon:yes stop_codon:yes gene_type:complete
MNVAIFGLGHIGIYHLREFIRMKCKIVGILVKNKIKEKQLIIQNKYNLDVAVFTNLDNIFNKDIDIVSICTPSNTHYYYISECIKRNINIFCEKPFIINTTNDILNTRLILDNIKNNKLKISVNTQWVYGIDSLINYFNIKPEKYIMISMSHSNNGIEFYSEMIPHMNSIIIYLFGLHQPKNINVMKNKDKSIIKFKYNQINVEYVIKYKEKSGNIISFIFDSYIFSRKIKDNYQQYFCCKDLKNNYILKEIKIEDPLMLSIKSFINNLNGDTSLIKKNDIEHNVILLDILLKHIK